MYWWPQTCYMFPRECLVCCKYSLKKDSWVSSYIIINPERLSDSSKVTVIQCHSTLSSDSDPTVLLEYTLTPSLKRLAVQVTAGIDALLRNIPAWGRSWDHGWGLDNLSWDTSSADWSLCLPFSLFKMECKQGICHEGLLWIISVNRNLAHSNCHLSVDFKKTMWFLKIQRYLDYDNRVQWFWFPNITYF